MVKFGRDHRFDQNPTFNNSEVLPLFRFELANYLIFQILVVYVFDLLK